MSLLISISLSNKNMAGYHTHINVINNLFFSFGFFSLLCPSLFLISPLTGSKRPSVTLPSSYFFSLLFLSKEEEKRRKIKYKFSGFFFAPSQRIPPTRQRVSDAPIFTGGRNSISCCVLYGLGGRLYISFHLIFFSEGIKRHG